MILGLANRLVSLSSKLYKRFQPFMHHSKTRLFIFIFSTFLFSDLISSLYQFVNIMWKKLNFSFSDSFWRQPTDFHTKCFQSQCRRHSLYLFLYLVLEKRKCLLEVLRPSFIKFLRVLIVRNVLTSNIIARSYGRAYENPQRCKKEEKKKIIMHIDVHALHKSSRSKIMDVFFLFIFF